MLINQHVFVKDWSKIEVDCTGNFANIKLNGNATGELSILLNPKECKEFIRLLTDASDELARQAQHDKPVCNTDDDHEWETQGLSDHKHIGGIQYDVLLMRCLRCGAAKHIEREHNRKRYK